MVTVTVHPSTGSQALPDASTSDVFARKAWPKFYHEKEGFVVLVDVVVRDTRCCMCSRACHSVPSMLKPPVSKRKYRRLDCGVIGAFDGSDVLKSDDHGARFTVGWGAPGPVRAITWTMRVPSASFDAVGCVLDPDHWTDHDVYSRPMGMSRGRSRCRPARSRSGFRPRPRCSHGEVLEAGCSDV